MKFNTALGLFLAGLALRGASRERGLRWRVVGCVCTALIACLGALTLTEYLFSWDAGLDNLVFRESSNAVDTSRPGRMAPHTAASFFLFGLAFLFSSSRGAGQRIFSQTLILCVVFIVLAVLSGDLTARFTFMASRSSPGWHCIPRSRFWRSARDSFARSTRMAGGTSFSAI